MRVHCEWYTLQMWCIRWLGLMLGKIKLPRTLSNGLWLLIMHPKYRIHKRWSLLIWRLWSGSPTMMEDLAQIARLLLHVYSCNMLMHPPAFGVLGLIQHHTAMDCLQIGMMYVQLVYCELSWECLLAVNNQLRTRCHPCILVPDLPPICWTPSSGCLPLCTLWYISI